MQQGLTEDKIAALDVYQESEAFTLQERMALRFAERMALAHRTIEDDFFRALRSEFTDAQIVELGMMDRPVHRVRSARRGTRSGAAGVHALRMTEGDDQVTFHVTVPRFWSGPARGES
jgi:hypothetical protein